MGDVNLEIKLNNLDDRVIKIEESDTPIIVDSELSDTSINPVQNKVITNKVTALASDVDKVNYDIVYYEQSRYLGKNLLNPTLETKTSNGITCTNNGDGTYILNGTSTADTRFVIEDNIPITSNSLKTVGCPSNGSESTYMLQMREHNSSGLLNWKADFGDGVIMSNLDTSNHIRIDIFVNKNITCYNLVFKPMLTTDLSVTYDDFLPYVPSNTEIQGSKADNSVVADVWNASNTYAVGQYCIYNNSLWKCLVQNNGQTPMEGTYWTKASITNELIALWNALNV